MPGGYEADDALWAALAECEAPEEMATVLQAWVQANEVYWSAARPSPAGWEPPRDRRPGWDWTPPGGLLARTHRVPLWVRACYHAPFVDRFACEWMWRHGGFDVQPPVMPSSASPGPYGHARRVGRGY
jgi:hypothetical protein